MGSSWASADDHGFCRPWPRECHGVCLCLGIGPGSYLDQSGPAEGGVEISQSRLPTPPTAYASVQAILHSNLEAAPKKTYARSDDSCDPPPQPCIFLTASRGDLTVNPAEPSELCACFMLHRLASRLLGQDFFTLTGARLPKLGWVGAEDG
jgi:hypothetical protein